MGQATPIPTKRIPFKPSVQREQILCRALMAAYRDGWNGSLSDFASRPYIQEFGVRGSTLIHFKRAELTTRIARRPAFYWLEYLTRRGVNLAEELFSANDPEGLTAKERVDRIRKEEVEAQKQAEREAAEACRLFRGLKIALVEGGKPRSLSSILREKHLDLGFLLSLDRRELLELGRQIEELRK